ncbi:MULTISPECIES: cation:proton antiporter [Gemella]|uniref:cation:proton antiporter n=1 Tax=Gemella TaxID=1378 RepID=UPI0007682209|nr:MULTISPECIES: monovalent cation/H(+) antiporter subunit G [Gemella]AME09920.1 cation:proton antiporter [Gemella sp. oral taxon 928]AXI26058.1 cation:proton antiporter [Gemella sp. ND 6198]
MILNNILSIIVILLILVAIVSMIATIIGFIRLPDELTKIHAAGVTGSFAVELILIAGFIYFYRYLEVFEYKFLLAILFLFLVAPVSAHMISLNAIIFNKKIYSKNNTDEAKKVLEDIKKLNK